MDEWGGASTQCRLHTHTHTLERDPAPRQQRENPPDPRGGDEDPESGVPHLMLKMICYVQGMMCDVTRSMVDDQFRRFEDFVLG